jgi:hypothetical protein
MELNESFEDKEQHVRKQSNVNMFKVRNNNTIKGLQCRVLMNDVTCQIRLWNFKIQEQCI